MIKCFTRYSFGCEKNTYDANGNTVTKANNTGTTSYGWDFENRLSSVTLPNGGGIVSFKYDPFGRGIYKSSANGPSAYLYDGQNLIEETGGFGAVVARYSDGPSTRRQSGRVAQPLPASGFVFSIAIPKCGCAEMRVAFPTSAEPICRALGLRIMYGGKNQSMFTGPRSPNQ